MDSAVKRFPNLPEELTGLEDIATNLWWSWHPAARMLFKTIDRPAWKESVHNPVGMLKEIPGDILKSASRNPEYLEEYRRVFAQFQQDLREKEDFFAGLLPGRPSPVISYFSAEYGLHHSLPFYAGGLGFLAGDYVKECSDLGIPLVAVGFMYPEGYVRQRLTEDGRQESMKEILDRDAASISRVLNGGGKQLVIAVPFIDPPIHVALWNVAVGRASLFLMDTDIPVNEPWNRPICSRLYVGDQAQRLRQEIVLGIGGYRMLKALEIQPDILHLNEGHPAFALLERVREKTEQGIKFSEASEQVRNTSVFTTHTPLAAGTDVFPFHLIEKYFSRYWPALGRLSHDDFMRLGVHPENPQAGFNMTVLAFRLCRYCNGVSRRNGEVARKIWHGLWPGLPEAQVPIDSVTNGVHTATWVEPKMELLFNKYIGPGWRDHCDDPAILTIGFARRFTGYKRADLIFHDLDRLKKIVGNRWRPVQIIFAGKAHPSDEEGKQILQRIFQRAKDPGLQGRVAFVEDYGEQFAQYLVHGVDVWLNTPLPPLEASGTSGMKAAINGVPNLSILDGWWLEGFNGKNGWGIVHRERDADRDGPDAEALYDLLEREIVPLYCRISDDGVPHGWTGLMKESILSCLPGFSSHRMLKEYVRKFYLPALNTDKVFKEERA